MKEQNLTFWAITTGNEPTDATIGYLFIKILDLGWSAVNQVLNAVFYIRHCYYF